jgi:hypothetical protein
MLRVTIELIPFGDQKKSRVIGQMQIVNTGTSKWPSIGHYDGWMCEEDNGYTEFHIKNHKRRDGFWVLLSKILNHVMRSRRFARDED